MRQMCMALSVALLSLAGAAQSQISGGHVKIGVLTDMNGPLSDGSGRGSVTAAKMAIADAAAPWPVHISI